MTTTTTSTRVFTPQEAFDAGRRLVRDRGDRLSDTQILRLAALVRMHLHHTGQQDAGHLPGTDVRDTETVRADR